jgi:phosphoribosylformylglycinamidine synthase
MLFSETTARALVAVPRGHEKAFTALCAEHGLPFTPLGVVAAGAALEVRGQFTIPVEEMRAAWSGTLPALFGGIGPEPRAAAPGDAAAVADDAAKGADDATKGDEPPAAS